MSVTFERAKQIASQENPELIARLLVSMSEHIESQKQLIDKIEAEKAAHEQQGFVLEEKVKLLRRQFFGKKSEIRDASDRPRDKSKEEALLFSQAMFPALDTRSSDEKNKAKGKELQEQVFEHEPTSAELTEESTVRGLENPSANQWFDTGLYDQCSKIQIIERSYVRELHRKKKFKLKPEYNPNPDKEVIITASGPASLLPGMNYTTEFVASVVADKYISHMPLERQLREMESLGLKRMKNSTLSRMCGLAAASLEPIQEMILAELKQSALALHIDETSWKIQNKYEKDGYMWIISNHSGSYYFFRPTRSAKVVIEKLIGYDGPVVTDGWASYDGHLRKAKIPRAYCWAHARREFTPLEDHDPTVTPILDLIDKLFDIERQAKTFAELAQLRNEESIKVIIELRDLLMAELPKSRSQSKKRKGIIYILKRWQGFTAFLTDTRIPLSNNEAERTIRHSVVGRKNYYGAGSYCGADTAATIFTLVESCKKNDIDPRTFLLMSLHRAATGEDFETPLALARRTRSSQSAN
jgi:transposase